MPGVTIYEIVAKMESFVSNWGDSSSVTQRKQETL